MTPSASASPIVLLTTAVDPAIAAANSSANATANTAASGDNALLTTLSGGFQLLIDAAAQQQSAPLAGSPAAKSQTKTAGSATDKSNEAGNVLPLLGALLPTDADPSAAEADKSSVGSKEKAAASTQAADDATANSAPDNSAVQLLWVPVNVQPAQAPAGTAVGTATAADAGSNSASSAAITALPSGAGQNVPATDDAAIRLDGDNAAVQQQSGSAQNKQATVDRNAGLRADVITATASGDSKPDQLAADLATVGSKPADGASFADLLKPLNVTQATAPTAINTMLDSGRTQQQNTRSYLEANGNSATVAVPVGSSGWTDAVADKVMWFSAHQFSSAEIQLNPPDLGPLQVRISTQHDQASVVFSSPHAAVRDALDQALPRLRDMLGGQGIQLSDASVGGQGAQRQQQQSGDNRAPTPGFFRGDESGDTPVAVTRVFAARLATSAVDAYV